MKQFLLLVSCLATVSVFAQVTSVTIEPYYVDNNTIAGYPDGHTTYRIYANCTNSNDVVSTIYGDIYAPLSFQVTGGGIWNTSLGGATGPSINPAFCGIFQEICLDSYVTVGRENLNSPGGTIFTLESAAQPWITNFAAANIGSSFTLDDEVGGAWFGLPGDVNCFPDANLKVLLAQVTTDGDITVTLNLQVFPNWTGAGTNYIEQTGLFATTGLVTGCTDPVACNFNPNANQDDGSCDYSCLGCTDAEACNYDAGATQDDGSCDYSCLGCTDPTACNYSMTATTDDGSCTYPGCTDVMACNYDSQAGCDDGSCDFSCNGCTDPAACNYSAGATIDDGSCEYSCYGCTSSTALNFDAAATIDDGTCLFSCMLMTSSSNAVDPSCSYNTDGSITISVTGAQGNYLWSFNGGAFQNLGNSETFSGLGNGSYSISIRDDRFDDLAIDPMNTYGECVINLNFTLETEAVVFCNTTTDDASCSDSWDGCAMDMCWTGGEGAISFQIIDNAGGTVFTDEDGNTVSLSMPNYCGLPEGSYHWLATDGNGCTFTSANFEIDSPDPLAICATTTEAVTCTGAADGCATAACVDGGTAPYSIDLHNADTDELIAGDLDEAAYCGLSGGNYYWHVTDANGCEVMSESFTVNEPSAIEFCEATTVNVTCNGGTDGCISNGCATGGTGSLIFELIDAATDLNVLDGDGNPVVLSTPDYCGLAAGSYYWIATDDNGCFGQSETYVITEPAPIVGIAVVDPVSCNGGNDGIITINASGGTGNLTCTLDGETDDDCTFTNLSAGVHTIMVYDESGCTVEIEVIVEQPEELVVEVETIDASCNGAEDGSVILTATGGTPPYAYVMNDTEQSEGTYDDLAAGDYTYLVYDANGCEVSGTATVGEPDVIEIIVDGSGGDGGSNEGFINVTVTGGNGGNSYEWTNGDGEVVGNTEDIDGLAEGTYTLCVTDVNGCEGCLATPVTITIGVAEIDPSMTIAVNPNPTLGNATLTISGATGQVMEMAMFDLTGKKVYQNRIAVSSADARIPMDISFLSAGVYQLTLTNGTQTQTIKVVKE